MASKIVVYPRAILWTAVGIGVCSGLVILPLLDAYYSGAWRTKCLRSFVVCVLEEAGLLRGSVL